MSHWADKLLGKGRIWVNIADVSSRIFEIRSVLDPNNAYFRIRYIDNHEEANARLFTNSIREIELK